MAGSQRGWLIFLVPSVLGACGSGGGSPFPLDMSMPDLSVIDGTFIDEGLPDGGLDLSGPDAPTFDCQTDCDPRTAMGCDEGMCVLYGSEPTCVTAAGDQTVDQPCSALSDCATGLVCVQREGGSVCRPICCPVSPAGCGTDERCVANVVLGDGSTTPWGACEPRRRCNVLTGDGCIAAMGYACYIVSSMGDTDCKLAGIARAGEACTQQTDCAGGLFCPAAHTCVRICAYPSGEPSCGMDEGTCASYSQSPPDTGLCTP
jgi:hypothetical protein